MASIGDHFLESDDLNEVYQTCRQFSFKWEEIGVRLGISRGIIGAIAEDKKSQSATCMLDMLLTWLKRAPRATWRILCDAIADVVGSTAAEKIAIDKGVIQTYSDPYFGQLYYQSLGVNKWLATFIVAKSLRILNKITPLHQAERMITFQFKDPVNGYIELDTNVPQERSFEGWTLEPHKKPLRITKKDADMFGKDEPAFCDITIQAKSDAVNYLSFEIRLNGIDSSVSSVYINLSLKLLGMNDWYEVTQTCEQFSAKWEEIGVRLGIHKANIDVIARDYESQSALCMTKILAAWLKMEIMPTWRILCDAIADVVGRTAAERIAIDKGVNQRYTDSSYNTDQISDVCHHVPGSKDLYVIFKECWMLTKDWKYIGSELGIELSILQIIEKDCDDVKEMMLEMLASWLNQQSKEQQVPSWNILLTILSKFNETETSLQLPSKFVGKHDSSLSGDPNTDPFSHVCHHELGYNDRYEVYKVCKTFSKDWKFIGLALGIEISILHTIKKDCDGVRQMMFEMITSWLIRETEEQPVPTWNILLTTLSEFDRVEAEKIASNFVCNHDMSTNTSHTTPNTDSSLSGHTNTDPFNLVCHHVLGIEDLDVVFDMCKEFSKDCKLFGLSLQVKNRILESIEKEWDSVMKRMLEMLASWLKRESAKQPNPSWYILITRLSLFDKMLAEDIARDFVCKHDMSTNTSHTTPNTDSPLSGDSEVHVDPFTGVCHCELDIENVSEVYHTCRIFSKDWKFIGSALGIEISILHTIKKDCASVREMMYEMIASWLKQKSIEQPAPTWNILLTTLSEFDRVEAEKIASNFVCNHADKELYKMEQALQKAVQESGGLKVKLAHYMPFGPPQVGKTCLLRRLVDKPPPGHRATIDGPCGNSYSTGALEEKKTIQVTVQTGSHDYEPKAVLADNSKWCEIESVGEEIAILVKTLANQVNLPNAVRLYSQKKPSVLESEPSALLEVDTNLQSNPTTSLDIDTSQLSDEHSTSLEIERKQSAANDDITHIPTNLHVSELAKKGVKNRNIKDVQELLDKSMTLYYTDTGGQPEFQEVLPALIAGPVIYLFIFNLLQSLDSTYSVTYNTPEQEIEAYTSSLSVKQMLMEFLTSIASYYSTVSRQKTTIPLPSVIGIGTHRDLIRDVELLKKIDMDLQQICASKLQTKQTINIEYWNKKKNQLIIPVDNYCEANDSIEVRRVVERIVNRDCTIEVPVPWLALELHLRSLPASTVTYTKCQEIAREFNIPDKDLPQCLLFLHHRTGTIRYYSHVDKLNNTIIIKPSFLFNAVTELITSTFNSDITVRGLERDRFQNLGLFKTSTVEGIFNNHSSKLEISFHAFLALLEHLYILGPSHDDRCDNYFFPCALVHAPEPDDVTASVDPLLLVFGCGFVPKGFFSSLLAFLCQKKWKIEYASGNKPCLYRNEASFFVEEHQNVNVRLKATNKCLEVFIKDDNPPTEIFCKIRQTLSEGSLDICSRLKYDEEVSKPQFGFYCKHKKCRADQHIAVVSVCSSKLVCEDTNRPYDMDSKRKVWFEDITNPDTSDTCDEEHEHTDGFESERHRDLLKKSPVLNDVFPLIKPLSASWDEIGSALNVSLNFRKNLRSDVGMNNDGRLEEVLNNWISAQTSTVTWEKILGVLFEIGERNSAQEVTKVLSTQRIYDKYINTDDFEFCYY